MGSPKQCWCRGLVAAARSLQGRAASLVRDLGGAVPGLSGHVGAGLRACVTSPHAARPAPRRAWPLASILSSPTRGTRRPWSSATLVLSSPGGCPGRASRRGGRSPCPCPCPCPCLVLSQRSEAGQHVGTLQPQTRGPTGGAAGWGSREGRPRGALPLPAPRRPSGAGAALARGAGAGPGPGPGRGAGAGPGGAPGALRGGAAAGSAH